MASRLFDDSTFEEKEECLCGIDSFLISSRRSNTISKKNWMIESSKKLLFVDKKEKKNTLRTTKERKKENIVQHQMRKDWQKRRGWNFFCFTKVQIFSCY